LALLLQLEELDFFFDKYGISRIKTYRSVLISLFLFPSVVSHRRHAELSVMRKFTELYYSPRNCHSSFTTVQLGNPCSTLKKIPRRFRDEK